MKKIFSTRKTKNDRYSGMGYYRSRGGDLFDFVQPSVSKVNVTEYSALEYAAVYAAVRAITSAVSSYPWEVFEQKEDVRHRLTGVNLSRLLRVHPNSEMTSKVFRSTIIAHALLWGDGYAEIERNHAGEPIALWPLNPDRMTLQRSPINRALEYRYQNNTDGVVTLYPHEVFHIKGLSPNGITGYPLIRMARESIGLGIAGELFAAAFFGNDARPSVSVEYPSSLKDRELEVIKDSLKQNAEVRKKWWAVFLPHGATIKTLSMPMKDSQFLETRKFQIEEIARWFGVPPHMIGSLERATFTNIEHQDRAFVRDCLKNWVVNLEEEANMKLVAEKDRGRILTKINLSELLRGDIRARGEFYKKMFDMGSISPNEIRSEEGLNPVAGGDIRLVPMNMTPLENAGQVKEKIPAPPNALHAIIADVFSKTLNKETKAILGALGKDDFHAWINNFFTRHCQQLKENLKPAIAAASVLNGVDVEYTAGLMFEFVDDYKKTSIRVIISAVDKNSLNDKFLKERAADLNNYLSKNFAKLLEQKK